MKVISSKEITTNRIFTVTWDHAVDPDGFEIERAHLIHHRGFGHLMMPVNERKRILLVRQYRLSARQFLWELPAGTVDPGEKPLQTARRRTGRGDRIPREEVDQARRILSQPRLPHGKNDHLSGHRSLTARGSPANG